MLFLYEARDETEVDNDPNVDLRLPEVFDSLRMKDLDKRSEAVFLSYTP